LRNLKVKEKAQIINSVESKCLNSRGNLAAKIDFNRRQTYIEDIFVVLHFAKSPQHFSCLHVNKSTPGYYDPLNNNAAERPFNENPQLREIGEIEIHKHEFHQEEEKCGCMVLRY